jgi:hypothetical protein
MTERPQRSFRLVVSSLLGVAALVSVTRASADELAPSDADARARLQNALDAYASEAGEARVATAFTEIGLGVGTLVPGVFLIRRSHESLQFFGTGLVVGGSIQLATTPLFLLPSPVERLRDILRAGAANDAGLTRAIEGALREAAEKRHTVRQYVGWISLALGVGTLASCASSPK